MDKVINRPVGELWITLDKSYPQGVDSYKSLQKSN